MRLLRGVLALAMMATSTPAHANCARPITYEVRVSGNTVEIEPVNFEGRGCPDPAGMLRQDVASGTVVRIADLCGGADAGRDTTYVDECVPAGRYRYGFAKPYACHASACSTDYFVEVTVDQPLATTCVRRTGDPGPTPASTVPWGSGVTICSYGGIPGGTRLVATMIVVALVAVGGAAAGVMLRRRRTPR